MGYIEQMTLCPLFSGVSKQDLPGMLACLDARRMKAEKGSAILLEGSSCGEIGVLLSGHAQIIRTDYNGNRTILMQISTGQLFAESFACAETEKLPFSIVASEHCDYLLINCRRILSVCSHACAFHNRIIFNLLQIVARENLTLHKRAMVTGERTTREKLTTYLLMQAKETDSAAFSIPFDRQGLADYLEVDRSGLSAELSKLKKEGLLDYHKNHFRLLRIPERHL